MTQSFSVDTSSASPKASIEQDRKSCSSQDFAQGAIRFADVGASNHEEPSSERAVPEVIWPKGWTAWLCVLGGWLLMFNSWGLVNAYGTFASFYRQHLLPGRDNSLLNLVGSTQSFVVLLLSAPVGRFLDAGHIRILTIAGTTLLAVGMFMLSLANGEAHYNNGNYGLIWLTQGLITGLGMSCFFVSSSQVVATWFVRKKPLIIGVVASGASIAGLVYPVMTKFLISEIGFNNAVRCVAGVVTGTSLLAVLLARPNPLHPVRKPERWLSRRVFVDGNAFREPGFCWFTAGICFLFFGFYAIFFNVEEWAAAKGLGYKDEAPPGLDLSLKHEVPKDAIRTFWLLSIMNASSTIGRVSSAYFTQHFGVLNVHATVTLIASLLVLILWTLASTLPAAIAFVVVFGVFSGAVIGLPPASMSEILGSGRQDQLGQWTGMMYSCASVFALTGPVIAGHLVSEYNTYLTVQLWSGVCLLLSSMCMGMAIVYHRKGAARNWIADRKRRLSSSVNSSVSLFRRTVSEDEKDAGEVSMRSLESPS